MDEETRIVTSAVVETQPLKIRNSNFEIRTSEFLHVVSLQRHGEQVRVQNKANFQAPKTHLTSIQKTGYAKNLAKGGRAKTKPISAAGLVACRQRLCRDAKSCVSAAALQAGPCHAKQSQFADGRDELNIRVENGL